MDERGRRTHGEGLPLTVEEYYKRQIDLEDKSTTIWPPAVDLATKVFK